MAQKIQLRRGTAAAWTTANSLLLAGEFGFETDSHKLKIGDGVTHWLSLPYSGAGPAYYTVVDAAARFAFSPTPNVGDIVEQTDTHHRWMACNVADLGRANGWQDLGQKPSTRVLFAEDGAHHMDLTTWGISGGAFAHDDDGSTERVYIDTPEYVTSITINDGTIATNPDCSACIALTHLDLQSGQFTTAPNITGLPKLNYANISYSLITDAGEIDAFFIALNAAASAGNVMGGSVFTAGTVAPTSASDAARSNLSGPLDWTVSTD